MFDTAYTQLVEIGAQKLLIAVADGRSWLVDIGSRESVRLPVSRVASERASLAAALIEGAIVAGLMQVSPAPAAEAYSWFRYVRWLVSNHFFAGHTPDLFRLGAQRLTMLGRPDLAELALQKAGEETGHAELAFRDLEALGLPAADVIRLVRPPSAAVFAERFREHVESSNPISLFGFSYCLERMAAERDGAFVEQVETTCRIGGEASRFLRVHSGIGSDAGHVHEQLAFFESLNGDDLAAIARGAFDTAELLAHQPSIDAEMTDEEMDRRLRQKEIGVFASG